MSLPPFYDDRLVGAHLVDLHSVCTFYHHQIVELGNHFFNVERESNALKNMACGLKNLARSI